MKEVPAIPCNRTKQAFCEGSCALSNELSIENVQQLLRLSHAERGDERVPFAGETLQRVLPKYKGSKWQCLTTH